MNTDELRALSDRIREAAKWAVDENDHFEPELGVQAADAIDALLSENALLERENEGLRAALERRMFGPALKEPANAE